MKKTTYNGIEISMDKTMSYGRYIIRATVDGVDVETETTDSMSYDYIDDPEDEEKHIDACRHCFRLIMQAYEGKTSYIIMPDGSIINHE